MECQDCLYYLLTVPQIHEYMHLRCNESINTLHLPPNFMLTFLTTFCLWSQYYCILFYMPLKINQSIFSNLHGY